MAEVEYKRFLQACGYILGEKLGHGSYGKVFRCTKLNEDAQLLTYAVKVVDIRLMMLESVTEAELKLKRLEREIAIMQRLNHRNIVKLHDVYRTKEAFFLIMDLVLGVDLFEMIVAENGLKKRINAKSRIKDPVYDERVAAEIFFQVAQAIQYMHSMEIIHRDIKPENIILQASDEEGSRKMLVKLIDFGLSKVVTETDVVMTNSTMSSAPSIAIQASKAKSLVGTPNYIAPEVSKASAARNNPFSSPSIADRAVTYGNEADLYSMGVLLHVMLGACFPQFDQFAPAGMSPKVVFQDDRIRFVSSEARDLISRLLEPEPSQRPTSEEILNHPWFAKYISSNNTATSISRMNTLGGRSSSIDKQTSDSSDETAEIFKLNSSLKDVGSSDSDASKKNDIDDLLQSDRPVHIEPISPAAATQLNPDGSLDIKGVQVNALEDPRRILNLQTKIAGCLKSAYDNFLMDSQITANIVSSAIGSRELLRVTAALLKKLEQTAGSVIAILPDFQLAVDEGEKDLVNTLSETIKEWIDELKSGANRLLEKNAEAISSVDSTIAVVRSKHRNKSVTLLEAASANRAQKNIVDKFNLAIRNGVEVTVEEMAEMLESSKGSSDLKKLDSEDMEDSDGESEVLELMEALETLREVDRMLQSHASFWSNMEVLIGVLRQRASHVESMTMFTKNPKLRERFQQRLEEYEGTWDNVRMLCQRFNTKAREVTPALYAFLTE